ncbi:MAG TPA: hypothetical protein VGX25_13375 [Actinophytocola sp.]|uniref:hypothetical protein n=1 Tax=Actinophytocola sp. TaxID=1872138 RepID=UPI002DDC9182|nr:hypothetical protein [Actinophytocola sp.]HEV2780374.1 hypothetical protein [Actinophytocola sp.]
MTTSERGCYTSAGKRITRKASGKTKTAAMNKLREILRDIEDGTSTKGAHGYTVADAVNDWLTYGLPGRDPPRSPSCAPLLIHT